MSTESTNLLLETAEPPISSSGSSLLRWVFSFPVMCMFLLIAMIFAFSIKNFAEPDIWWHLRNAAYLFQQHSFPTRDTYSFTAFGSYRLNYEWLSEIPFFLAFKAGGLRGILLVYFVVLVFIYAGAYYLSCRAGADCKDATLATMLAVSLGVVSFGPRVLLFGWLCMVALLIVLDHFERTGKGVWFLPPLFALWINLHGSWVFGLVVLAISIVSGLIEGEWGLVVARRWVPGELRKLLLALAASVAALFINPFGYRVVFYPFDFLFRQQSNMQYVEEWQPVDFSSSAGKLAMIVIFGLIAASLFSRRRWRLDHALLTAFALWAGLSHTRFLFFTGLIVVPILAPNLTLFPPYERELDKPWLNAIIMAAVAVSLFTFFPSQAELQQKVDNEYPQAALEFMQREHIKGKTFNQYFWGGYMEWYAPELKPFIDGRADIFVYNGVLEDHRKIMGIDEPIEALDKYGIEYALLQPNRPLTYVLYHDSGWRSIYNDKVAVLFERVPTSSNVIKPGAR